MKGAAINSSFLQISLFFACWICSLRGTALPPFLPLSHPHSLVLVVPFPSIPDTQGAFRFKKKVARQRTVLPSCLVRFCTARPAQSLRPCLLHNCGARTIQSLPLQLFGRHLRVRSQPCAILVASQALLFSSHSLFGLLWSRRLSSSSSLDIFSCMLQYPRPLS